MLKIQNASARLIFNEPKRMHVTPLFINLHWLPIADRIKFKALMFAYKTISLPKFITSEWTTLYCAIPKRHKITFTDFYIKFSLLVEWPAQLNQSNWVLSHLQEPAKNTSLPSLFDPLTLALSILNLFFKKNNTSFSNLFVFYLFVFFLFIIQLTKAKRASNTSLLYSFSI